MSVDYRREKFLSSQNIYYIGVIQFGIFNLILGNLRDFEIWKKRVIYFEMKLDEINLIKK